MKFIGRVVICCLPLLLSACASLPFRTKTVAVPTLSAADERRFDYFYHEGLHEKAMGDQAAAFDLFQKALRIDSANAAVKYELANYYLNLKRPNVALKYLRGAVKEDSTNYWYGMHEARLLQGFGRHDEAIQSYQRLEHIFPRKAEISYSLADAYTALGRHRESIAALNKLQEHVGVNQAVILEKHLRYLDLKEVDSAFMEIHTLVEAFPYERKYRLLLGDRYLDLGMMAEADSVYQEMEEAYPNDPYVLLSRSNYYNREGDVVAVDSLIRSAVQKEQLPVDMKVTILTEYLRTLFQKDASLDEIDSLFTIVINQHPQAGELNSLYANFLITSKRLDESTEQLAYAIDKNPSNKELWMQLISVQFELKQYAAILNTAERAIAQFPTDGKLYLYKASAYLMQEEQEASLQVLEEALLHTPVQNVTDLAFIWGQKGDVLYLLKRYGESYAAYEQSLEFNPKGAMVMNNYAYNLLRQNEDLKKAERLAGEAVKLSPKDANILDTYAWIFFKQGNYMLARFYLQQALNYIEKPTFELLDHYGDILFHEEDEAGAIAQWEKAVEAAPHQEQAPDKEQVALTKEKIKQKKYISE